MPDLFCPSKFDVDTGRFLDQIRNSLFVVVIVALITLARIEVKTSIL